MGGLVDIPLSRLSVARTGTATRVNSAGVIETVAANMPRISSIYGTVLPGGSWDSNAAAGLNRATNTETFASGWGTTGATIVTTTVPALAGGLFRKIAETATTGLHAIVQATGSYAVGQLVTVSVFAKAAERSQIAITQFGEPYAAFDLSSGSVILSSGLPCGCVDYGGGIWRCWVTFTKTGSSGDTYILPWAGGPTYAGAAGSGVLVWGVKVEAGGLAGYVPEQPVSAGLLVEEVRTNLLPASGAIYAAPWSASNGVGGVTATATGTAPDGAGQWAQLTAGSAGGDWRVSGSAVSGGARVTGSIYAQRGNQPLARWQLHLIGGATTGRAVSYNFDTGAVSADPGVTVTVTPAAGGAVRIAATFTDDGDSGTVTPYLLLHTSLTAGDTTLYWGAQVEVGGWASSYIPTTAAAATRGADDVTMPAGAWWSATAGTFVVRACLSARNTSVLQGIARIDDGTSANNIRFRVTTSGGFQYAVTAAGATVAANTASDTVVAGSPFRVGVAFEAGAQRGALNGALLTATAGALPSGLTTLRLGQDIGAGYLNGHILRLEYAPRRLSDVDLQAVTAGGALPVVETVPAKGNCLLSWVNLAQRSATTVASTSSAAGLGPDRLKDPQVRRRMRTGPGAITVSLPVDLGSTQEVGVLALLQPDDAGWIDADGEAVGYLDPTSDTIRHRLDAATTGTGALYDSLYYRPSDYLVDTLDLHFAAQSYREFQNGLGSGVVRGYGLHAHILPAAVQARYWQPDVAFPSLGTTPGYLDLGLLWAGPAFRPSRNFVYEWGDRWDDLSDVTEVRRSGQEFVDRGPKKRVLTFAFKSLTEPEAKVAMTELGRIAGTSRQVLFIQEPNGPYMGRQAIIGRLVEVSPITQTNFVQFERVFQIRQSL
ncbi:hypothetical protein TSH58p_22640 (plasmid) [Azospirillum sp. TSH58]|uniref:phage head spike fiber domain-containing protein n=1 Tax=Azospirillum sp. TSH58 TaxID=664962 RepID=UPI000D601853|nr:hypothetical protein [Azospirillum sp. TSH58]AWJ86317.1 hypothetical protein TSH58p_22640 [Azospirillum sp. TSH58]PWC73432.1 hypothetical protein TSH58_04475 [Azospirillum sp. TSH58]